MNVYLFFLVAVGALNLGATGLVLYRLARRANPAIVVATAGAAAFWLSVGLILWGPRERSSEALSVAGEIVAVARVEQVATWVIVLAVAGLLVLYGAIFKDLSNDSNSSRQEGDQ